ncbi:prephenate dehydrogenase [Streptococcus suis]|uniref:prephenate dehydrogenase n=1 Tax=Streptococcus suis TaxID=1307 RepID=UPI00209A73FA|nr:prephenate dehydrogenase [Streptococcus suis]MCO8188103.1 prephenate dehydrogenase [Streptococcus suis]HEM3501624.1 prephenate dehydrogenase [Streptococcus suis]
MKKTILIVGLGLIGSSLALCIRKDHPDYHLIGFDPNEQSCQIALGKGMVDEVSTELEVVAKQADVILLCVPIQVSLRLIEEFSSLELKDTVLITDAGSTKSAIVAAAEEHLAPRQINFIGGHPMAGSHKSGASAADLYLFENAYYIMTPCQATKQDAVPRLTDLLSGTGARFVQIDAAEHDRVTSQISHFPHVLASSLMHQAGEYAQDHPFTNNFAAGGFRDMTRIAESEPSMWTSILLTNADSILNRIEEFQERLSEISDVLRSGDQKAIWDFFDKGRQTRKAMEIHKRAGVDSFYDLFLSVPDEEDTILKVLEVLRGISIVNIRINEENREDIHGILQITFKNKGNLEDAAKRLREQTTYKIHLD